MDFLSTLFSLRLGSQFQKALAGGVQGCFLFCKMKADEAVFRFAEETGAGHASHADLADEPFGGVHVARKAKRRNIEHHVIRALWFGKWQAGLAQVAQK